MDGVYYMNEQQFRPAAGLEVNIGLLALRAGYKGGNGNEEFSIGTGLMIGRSSFDYSFGMMDGLDSRHRVSLSMRFSGSPSGAAPVQLVNKLEPKLRVKKRVHEEVAAATPAKTEAMIAELPIARHSLGSLEQKKTAIRRNRVYIVREGDTLGKIAAKHYGTKTQAARIYSANKHLMENPSDLTVGQKIILPQ